MKRNHDAQKLVKSDRRSPPKSSYMILDDFFSDSPFDVPNKRSLRPQGSSPLILQHQKLLTDPVGRGKKKKVRFAVRRNKAYPPSSPSVSQSHWTPADRKRMISEQSREAKTILQQERSWGYLPNLLRQIHIESYFPWDSMRSDPILTHLYRQEPERLLGIERLHAPWRRSRDSSNTKAAANYALRLGLSLAESLKDDNPYIDDDNDDPMIVDNWGESFCCPEYPLIANCHHQDGFWI